MSLREYCASVGWTRAALAVHAVRQLGDMRSLTAEQRRERIAAFGATLAAAGQARLGVDGRGEARRGERGRVGT